MKQLNDLLLKKKIIVCCGAGGVGKTTTSAALALRAAQAGRRVLVVTIDPAKRLAETLGLDQNPLEPLALSPKVQKSLGIKAPGNLSAWILNPQLVADRVVHYFSHSPEEEKQLLNNPLYRNVTAMVAGMQEYTAVQAMYEFAASDKYDLIVLDTPPSRNALNFLQAPKRITRLIDGRVFRFFLPAKHSLIKRASSKMVNKVLGLAFGDDTRDDLLTFFELFSGILSRLSGNASCFQSLFKEQSTAFLVITSPAQASLDDADYFAQKSRDELDLPLAGYIFNRSKISLAMLPTIAELPPEITLTTAVRKELEMLASRELSEINWQRGQLDKLKRQLSPGEFICQLPVVTGGANDLSALLYLSRIIAKR